MNSTNHTAVRTRRRSAAVGLAAGAGVAVAVFSMGIAHADDGSASTDLGLLDSAASDLSQASEVLSKASVPDSLQQALSGQIQIVDAESTTISAFQSFQDPLLSSENSLVSGLASLFFGDVNQEFAQASAATLAADQAFAADPSQSTEPGLVFSDFQFVDGEIDSVFPDIAWRFVSPLLGNSVEPSDAAGAASAGADLATGFSPDLFF